MSQRTKAHSCNNMLVVLYTETRTALPAVRCFPGTLISMPVLEGEHVAESQQLRPYTEHGDILVPGPLEGLVEVRHHRIFSSASLQVAARFWAERSRCLPNAPTATTGRFGPRASESILRA